MQDVELFIHMAEIAGVFVGFGALIALRSGSTMAAGDLSSIRWVVTTGIWVVIAAITPIIVSAYALAGHQLWLVCSLLALGVFAVMVIVNARAPENWADLVETLATTSRARMALIIGPTFWLPTVFLVVALALVALGPYPHQEQAIYLTALGLGLFMGALHLFVMVFWQ